MKMGTIFFMFVIFGCLNQQRFLQIQMNAAEQFNQMIISLDQEVNFIESNRAERNKRYRQCMNAFKGFLNKQTEQFQITSSVNDDNKELVSSAFDNTFQRVIASSDVSIRKIKQTFNQKKIFWDNVIKMNSDINDIQLKKQFYNQKRNAEDGYIQAIDRQKDKHKTYKSLVDNNQKKQQLRQYQQSNKVFQQKVTAGSNTLQQWQNLINNPTKYVGYNYGPDNKTTMLNQFVRSSYPKKQGYDEVQPLRQDYYSSNEPQNSTLFLNNFQKNR